MRVQVPPPVPLLPLRKGCAQDSQALSNASDSRFSEQQQQLTFYRIAVPRMKIGELRE